MTSDKCLNPNIHYNKRQNKCRIKINKLLINEYKFVVVSESLIIEFWIWIKGEGFSLTWDQVKLNSSLKRTMTLS